MPHSRTDIDQDDQALRWLSGCEYKTMHYLINRADPIGVSYPKVETIAEATGHEERHVRRALEVLHENNVFRYRRRNAYDPDTRRKQVNVYQVNPDIIMIAPEFEAEARSEWLSLTEKCDNHSTGLWSPLNQHQEPIPLTNSRTSTREPTPKTTTPERAKGGAADYANQREGTDSPRGRKANDNNPAGKTGQRAATTNQQAQPAEQTGSAGRAQYANPATINTNLPDAEHEALASSIRQFGISMPLARGFVAEYGYKRVKAAFESVREMGDKARQPAAVFRSICQIRLAEDFALAQEQILQMRKQSR